MDLLVRLYLFWPWICHLLAVLWLWLLEKVGITDINHFSLVLRQPLLRNIHISVSRAIAHLKREHLHKSELIRQKGVLFNHCRSCHPATILSQSVDLFVSFVLHHTKVLPLLDYSPLLGPPLGHLCEPSQLVSLAYHVAQLTNNYCQLFERQYFVFISDFSLRDSLIVECELVQTGPIFVFVFEEGISKQSEIKRNRAGFPLGLQGVLVRVTHLSDGFQHSLHAIKIIVFAKGEGQSQI